MVTSGSSGERQNHPSLAVLPAFATQKKNTQLFVPLSKKLHCKKKGSSHISLTLVTFIRFAEKNSQGVKHKVLSEALAGSPQEIHYSGTSLSLRWPQI